MDASLTYGMALGGGLLVALLLVRLFKPRPAGEEVQRTSDSAIRVGRRDTKDDQKLSRVVLQINAAAEQISETLEQQERGSRDQLTAMEETRRTLGNLVDSGRTISGSAQSVLSTAERTLVNHEKIIERIQEMASHANQIDRIVEMLRQIADKSDVLALNAALEGTRAGEAGRGFGLVANEMRRLVERIMEALHDIRELTTNVKDATSASVASAEEGKKLVEEASRSAREIALGVQQQQAGIEQVNRAMVNVNEVAQVTVAASKEAQSATEILREVSQKLVRLVEGGAK